nr:MAG TPA: hypothetical protein [Bacteriophage sp.]
MKISKVIVTTQRVCSSQSHATLPLFFTCG